MGAVFASFLSQAGRAPGARDGHCIHAFGAPSALRHMEL